VFNFSGPPSE